MKNVSGLESKRGLFEPSPTADQRESSNDSDRIIDDRKQCLPESDLSSGKSISPRDLSLYQRGDERNPVSGESEERPEDSQPIDSGIRIELDGSRRHAGHDLQGGRDRNAGRYSFEQPCSRFIPLRNQHLHLRRGRKRDRIGDTYLYRYLSTC